MQDLQRVLNGGSLNFLGQNIPLLGLKNSRAIVQGAIASLPPDSQLRPALQQVANFANLAIEGLGFATPGAGLDRLAADRRDDPARGQDDSDGHVRRLDRRDRVVDVRRVLLAAGLLALERSENAYSRLVRGLISPTGLLSEKVVLSAAAAGAVTLVMSAFVSLFVHLDWARFPLWLLALAFGGLAFAALGVAIGGLAREVSVASLMAFLLTLPVAFVALVPADAVSGTVESILNAVAFVFPFKAALQAASNAFSGAAPGIVWPLVHLAVLTLAFGALARLALRRFA